MSPVIDFHSHVLPGIDDGSSGVEESIGMLKRMAEQGITHVVATPHFYAQYDNPERFLRRRDEAESRLREAMEKYSGLPTLSVGAEVYYFSGISDCDALLQLTIDKKNCIMLEMKSSPWDTYAYREVEGVSSKLGLTPIIAHVDRYIAPFKTYRIPQKLQELPALVQANASFFLNRSTRSMAFRMLKKGQIHLLGSDCHDLERRPPRLGDAIELIRTHGCSHELQRMESLGSEILFP